MRHNPPTPAVGHGCYISSLSALSNMLSAATKYFAGVMMLLVDVQRKQAKPVVFQHKLSPCLVSIYNNNPKMQSSFTYKKTIFGY